MKTNILPRWSMAVAAAVVLNFAIATPARAQDAAKPKPVVDYAAEQIVKLHQAGVGESVLQAYAERNGPVRLSRADDIIYLRESGVSEKVITTMLLAAPAPAPVPAMQPVPAPAYTPAPAAPQPATVYVQQPQPVYVVQQQPSVVYSYDYGVPSYSYYQPYCAPVYSAYRYNSYYWPRGGYCGPRVSVGIGFGGHHNRGFVGFRF